MNITNDWINATRGKKGIVIEKMSYVFGGTNYIVDGIHVILRPSKQERKVAETLSKKYGKTVELVPQVMYPQGIQTPDYLVDGERFGLKCFKSSGKNLIYNLISKKKNQSPNFIFDITECPLGLEEIERQINNLYSSTHTKFVDVIVVIKNNDVISVYCRD